MNPLVVIVIAFVLAVATEGAVEVIFGRPISHIPKLLPFKDDILTGLGIAAAVFLCLYYKVDMLAALSSLSAQVDPSAVIQPSIVGHILSGTVVGRGSNAVHDFISKILTGKVPLVALFLPPEKK